MPMVRCTSRSATSKDSVTSRMTPPWPSNGSYGASAPSSPAEETWLRILDMERVEFLDSNGIAALVDLHQNEANCDRIVLLKPTDRIVKVLEVGGVIRPFTRIGGPPDGPRDPGSPQARSG